MTDAQLKQDFYPLAGGLDTMTPALMIDPGKCFDAQNYEPVITGGYRRIDGYERFDGRPSPSAAPYWLMVIALTGAISVGDALTGMTSGATCRVLQINAQDIVVGRVVGTFVVGEDIANALTVGTVSQIPLKYNAPQPKDDANYRFLAANDLRNDIGAVPGTGFSQPWRYKGVVYAFRDNLSRTANSMYVSSAAGWVLVPFGLEIALTTLTHAGTVTVTTANPAVFTWAAHGMANGQPLILSTTGTLPNGFITSFTYYVVAATANTFELASSVGGTPIAATAAGTGTITATASGNNIYAGDTIVGQTSGATAVVAASLLRSGSWTANLAGTLVIASESQPFITGENLSVNGLLVANVLTPAAQIIRAPGGTLEFCNINFTGSVTAQKMYGVDGVNPAFEFDGTTYVPIHTGTVPDTPAHVINFKESLLLAIQGNVEISSLGQPYNYDPVQGAGSFGIGDTVTGFTPNGGTYQTGSTMSIFTDRHLYTLYGSSTANFNLVTSIWDMGFSARTMQPVSNDTYGWTSRGIQTIITTLTFGDFDYNSISHEIQSVINAKQGMQISSTSLHSKDQYRVYFRDGTALAVGLTGDKMNGIMPLNYGIPVRSIFSDQTPGGPEVTFFGSDNGFVYQDNVGTSQDGQPIEAWIRLAFNHTKSPRVRKRYRRAIFEGVVEAYSLLNISYDMGYGNPDVQQSAPVADTGVIGAGGYWDQFTWDEFIWDAQVYFSPTLPIDGTEKNISFLVYSKYAQYRSHTFQGVTLIYTPRRLER